MDEQKKETEKNNNCNLHCPLASNSWNEIALYTHTQPQAYFKKNQIIKTKIRNPFGKNKFVILKILKQGEAGGEEEFYFVLQFFFFLTRIHDECRWSTWPCQFENPIAIDCNFQYNAGTCLYIYPRLQWRGFQFGRGGFHPSHVNQKKAKDFDRERIKSFKSRNLFFFCKAPVHKCMGMM